MVVLEVPNEASLKFVCEQLANLEIAHTPVVECDEPYSGQLMSVGLELVRDRSKIRIALSSLPLYGKTPKLADKTAKEALTAKSDSL